MKNNTIKLSGGSIIGINELGKNSSLKTVILQKTFLVLCEFVAFKYYNFNKDSDSYKTLINSLFLKSNKLRTIASIIEFNKLYDIEEVNFDIDLTDFNHFFTSKHIVFFGKTNANQQWINKSELVYSILKWLANKLYSIIYFFSGKQAEKNKSNTVIRSWVDDAEKIYKAEFKTSIILIYPFLLNPLRGLRYIRNCFKNYKYPVLVGIPYNFIDLIRIIFSKGVSFDGALIEFENKAMVKHANLFKDFNIIYTSDEYMVNSHVLHSILMQQSKKVINKAHGIGFYSPYVNYDEMHMYNENQINHYRTKNKSISYFILKESIIDSYIFTTAKKPAIVFIDHGNLEQYNLFYESKLQHETILFLIDFCKKLEYPLYIKFSPQTSSTGIDAVLKKYKYTLICSNVEKLSLENNILFVNLFSTAYYDFSKYGKVLFIETDIFKPALMFGNDIECSSFENLEYNIRKKFIIN
jgi:hypothetical protein